MAKFTINLHSGQEEIYSCPTKHRVAVMGRRYGKSRLQLYEMILASLCFPGEVDLESPQVVLGTLPTLQQAKGILWNPLVSLFTETDLSLAVADINKSDHVITMKNGKPSIVVVGANDKNGDGLRGKRIYFYAGDEAQDYKPGIFDYVILPAMADTPGSRSLITGTPKGKLNILYDLYQRTNTDPNSYTSFNHPTWRNDITPGLSEEIEKARLTLPPRVFEQEFQAGFVDFPGKIYYELSEANLTTTSPVGAPKLTVFGVDWGDRNPAIAVLRLYGNRWYYIDGWNPLGNEVISQPVFDKALCHLHDLYCADMVLCDPSRPSSILGVRSLGLPRVKAGFNRIEEGIGQVLSLIYAKRLMFLDIPTPEYPGCCKPYSAYEMHQAYHRHTDNNGKVTQKVAEGQPDHIIDALRYAVTSKDGRI